MDINCTSALPCEGDVILAGSVLEWTFGLIVTYRVTSKGGDVLSNPVDSQFLVLDGEVLLLAVSEREDIETVIQRNHNDWFPSADGVRNNSRRV